MEAQMAKKKESKDWGDITNSIFGGKGVAEAAAEAASYKYLPQSVYALNLQLGGGLMMNRITEIQGPQGVGKSTLLMQMISCCVHYHDCVGILTDIELAADLPRLAKFGLYTVDSPEVLAGEKDANLVLLQPIPGVRRVSIESMFTSARDLRVAMNKAGDHRQIILGIDAIPGMKTEASLDAGPDSKQPGVEARAWRQWLPWFLQELAAGVTLVGLNHVTSTIPMGFVPIGTPTQTTPGGSGWRYYSSVRVSLFPGKQIKQGTQSIGRWVTVKNEKSRATLPNTKIKVPMYFGNPNLEAHEDFVGVHDGMATYEHLKSRNIIKDSTLDKKAGEKLNVEGSNIWWPKSPNFEHFMAAFDEHKDEFYQAMSTYHFSVQETSVALHEAQSLEDMIAEAGKGE
jgi:RecA/RadA recombinase